MKTEQEKIEEMAGIKYVLIKTHKRCRTLQEDYMQNKYAEEIYKAGYRKATEVIDEFVERLKKVIHERDYIGGYAEIGLCEEIDELATEMWQEMEK